jgi:hypothetical protein
VRVLRNVRNDGTFPGLNLGAPLVRRGSTGYVCDLGLFLQDQIIYTVHFLAEDQAGRLSRGGVATGQRALDRQPLRVS